MTTSAAERLRVPHTNPVARCGVGDSCATERLARPICIPQFSPSFQITAASDVFAIGSCFAADASVAP
jgi:hypothetical protein